jgi:Copine/C2 domain
VAIFDEVRKTGKAIPMGSACFEMGEVLAARGSIKAKKLRDGGTIFARVTRASSSKGGVVRGLFRGSKLKNVEGIFGKSDPFFRISRQVDIQAGHSWHPVYLSETVKNNLDPVWKSFAVTLDVLCGENKDLPLLIEVFDWEKSGQHRAMGSAQTTVNSLLFVMGGSDRKVQLLHKNQPYGFLHLDSFDISGEGATAASIAASASKNTSSAPPQKFVKINGINKINPEYKKWKDAQGGQTPTPTVAASAPMSQSSEPTLSERMNMMAPTSPIPPPLPPPVLPQKAGGMAGTVIEKPKFVDYIAGGTEINLVVGIDYTGSNGDPRKPGTLHYIHPDGQLNDYEKALTAVGSIVARYDSDQMFPVLGFGAKYGGVIQHCFQVGSAPELHGIKGMLEAYRGVFKTGLTMSGPTVFSEVIDYAAAQARATQQANAAVGEQSYSILLILTDGEVSDMEQTKRSIRAASDAPLSIVIVGIGSADFTAMQFLDDFHEKDNGRTRDIVQFVQFNLHKYDKESLTRATLDEIPDQLVDYFAGRGIMPLPPVSGSRLNITADEYSGDDDINLSMRINSDGNIDLSNPDAATWNAHAYATASTFLTSASARSYGGQSAPNSYSGGTTAAGGSYVTGGASPNYPSYGTGGASPAYPMATAIPVTRTPVQVKAPANSYPGMQLRVQSPTTGQFQIITVPQGVAPGTNFIVQL